MKRKMLMSVLFSFAVCCAYSFEPGLFVMDELQNIQTKNGLRYQYAWGENSTGVLRDAWKKGITITQTFAIRDLAWSMYKEVEKNGFLSEDLGEPRTVAEATLMASLFWNWAEYLYIANAVIIREEK